MGDNDIEPTPYLSFGCLVQPPEDEPVQSAVPVTRDTSVANFDHHEYISPSQRQPAHQTKQALPQETIEQTFGEMVMETPAERNVPLVVLDCANIGWTFGIDNFSAQGVNIAIQYFQGLGVEIQAFIPAAYLRAKPRQIDNITGNAMMITDEVESLHRLAACSLLSIVPSGDNDDAYILNYARDNNGYVISNDLFNDHLRSIEVESVRTSMRVWLTDNRCGYSFTSRQQFIFNPCSSLRSAIQAYHAELQQRQQLQQQQQQEDSVRAAAADNSYGGRADNRPSASISNSSIQQRDQPLSSPQQFRMQQQSHAQQQPVPAHQPVYQPVHQPVKPPVMPQPLQQSAHHQHQQYYNERQYEPQQQQQYSQYPSHPYQQQQQYQQQRQEPYSTNRQTSVVGRDRPTQIRTTNSGSGVGDGSNSSRVTSGVSELQSLIASTSDLINQMASVDRSRNIRGSSRSGDGKGAFTGELKWLLLTRASLLIKAGQINAAERDLHSILQHIDSSCTEAHAMLQSLASTSNSIPT